MSQWTHVSGAFRFDYLRGHMPPIDWDDLLGRTCTFDSEQDEWKACSVPCGSEGSIQFEITENPHHSTIAAYNVMVWGDLRDFGPDRVKEVIRWFRGVCRKCQEELPAIRDAVITIDVEGDKPWVLVYGDGRISTYKDGVVSASPLS